jgi:hypothetical protein
VPRKLEFERELVNIAIRRKDHIEMRRIMGHKEPYYSVIHRIWQTYNTSTDDLEFLYTEQVKATQQWMKRALNAEKQLSHQTKLL